MAYLFHYRPFRPRCKLCGRGATRRLVTQDLRTAGYYCDGHAGAEFAKLAAAESAERKGVAPIG